MNCVIFFIITSFANIVVDAFLPIPPKSWKNSLPSQLSLIPLSEVWDVSIDSDDSQINNKNFEPFSQLVPKLGCKSFDNNGALISSDDTNGEYKLYLATHIDDLPPIAHLTLEVFDATAITLSTTNDWSSFEKAVVGAVVEPAISMYNSYAYAVGYIEVLSGLRRRMTRIITDEGESKASDSFQWFSPLVTPDGSIVEKSHKPSTPEEIAAQSSLILVLARWLPNKDLEAAASIEIRLQPTDAKIPFSQPWLDNVERKLISLLVYIISIQKV